MNREKIVNAILEEYRKFGPSDQEQLLLEAIKRISSDTNLLAFALDLGIDTDAIYAQAVRS